MFLCESPRKLHSVLGWAEDAPLLAPDAPVTEESPGGVVADVVDGIWANAVDVVAAVRSRATNATLRINILVSCYRQQGKRADEKALEPNDQKGFP